MFTKHKALELVLERAKAALERFQVIIPLDEFEAHTLQQRHMQSRNNREVEVKTTALKRMTRPIQSLLMQC